MLPLLLIEFVQFSQPDPTDAGVAAGFGGDADADAESCVAADFGGASGHAVGNGPSAAGAGGASVGAERGLHR